MSVLVQPGRIIGEKYRLERPLARGGGGTVWVARHIALDIDVALKLVSEERPTPKGSARFRREARAAARLKGDHVVHVYDFGFDGEHPYMAMELLDGEDLRSRLARGGRLPLPAAIEIIAQVGSALRQAHAIGLIHRDLKPANLFMARAANGEVVKVLDFGIAKDVESDLEEGATTQGSVLGTPAYMAPEQARGDGVDHRTDLWSLAVVLLELVTGQNALRGTDLVDTIARISCKPLPVPSALAPGLPAAFDLFMDRALTRAMTGRFASIDEFLAALERVTSSDPAPSSIRPTVNPYGRDDETVDLPCDSTKASPAGDARPPPSMRARHPPLSSEEERLECYLVVRGWVDPASGAESTSSPWAELQRLVRACRGNLDRVVDGSLLATFSSAVSAGEQARLAAHCALALEGVVGLGRLVLVVGRQTVSRGILDLTQRAHTLLAGDTSGIRLEKDAVSLLTGAFLVAVDPTGCGTLVGPAAAGREPSRHLVGRDREVDTLIASAVQCLRSTSLRTALVTGPPGIGKTRLLQEVAAILAHEHHRFDVWYGRADQATAPAPFALIADLLRRRLGEPPRERFHDALLQYATRYVPAKEAGRIAAFLGEAVVGAGRGPSDPLVSAARMEPRLMYDQIGRAFADLLHAHVSRWPVAIFVDQLQEADTASAALLMAAMRTHERRSLFVVGGAQDDDVGTRWTWPEAAPPLIVPLARLDDAAATQLVRAMVGHAATPGQVAALVSRGLGHPQLIEELARASGADTEIADAASVTALVEARILGLPPETRRVLRAASLFGSEFSEAGVRELLRVAPDELVRQLSVLAANDIVEAVVAYPGAPPSKWAFRNTALRDAAYEMIPTADRQAAHRAAGYYLEGVGPVDPATLATHFDRGGRARRAARHYGHAARQALMGNDVTSALKLGERAVELVPDADAAGALVLVAESLHARGESQKALERAVEAMRILPRGSPDWLTAASVAAMAASRLGEHRVCANLARELIDMPAPSGHGPSAVGYITACARLGHVLFVQSGEGELARAVLSRAELEPPVTERAQPLAYAALCRARSYLAHEAKDLRASWRWLEESARAFQIVGDRRSAALAISSAAHLQYQCGLNEGAADALEMALELIGDSAPFNRALMDENRGAALARLGRHDEAIASLRKSLAAFSEIDDRRAAAGSRTYLAPLLASRNLHEAFEHARQAVLDASVQPPLEAYARGVLAQLELDHGDPSTGLAHAKRGMEIVSQLGGITEGEAMVRLVYVRALERAGDEASAERELRWLCAALAEEGARFVDPELRRAFWEGVTENREALALGRARIGFDPTR